MVLVVTLTQVNCRTSEKSVGKDEGGQNVNDLVLLNHSCFGGCLIVAPLLHLLLISLTPKQLKLINGPPYYLTDQINIPEVELS